VAWVETQSLSFSARHESDQAEAAERVLEDLELFRTELAAHYPSTPGGIGVVLHPRPFMLVLAHPWLPLARQVADPASRRYFAGWFNSGEIHVLAPAALEQRASGSEGSREALLLAPRHEYAHLVVGANNPDLPPPFSPRSFRRYVRAAWVCEGAATWLAGQVPHLRAAITRRLHDGGPPELPPSARDAQLLGGTLFSLLEQEAGAAAAVELATISAERAGSEALQRAFDRPLAQLRRDWRAYLDALRI
jgi:hypothetical protein